MRNMRFLVAALAAFAMTALVAAPASAQQQQGLVNVNVTDIEVIAQVPIGIAANVCPTANAAVLASDLRQDGEAECDAQVAQMTDAEQRQLRVGFYGDGAQQEGLVNVNLQDIDVIAQVPIGIAANVCLTANAAVLASDLRQDGEAECEARVDQMTRAQQRQIRIIDTIPV